MEVNAIFLVLLLTVAAIIEPAHILCPRPKCPDLEEAVISRVGEYRLNIWEHAVMKI